MLEKLQKCVYFEKERMPGEDVWSEGKNIKILLTTRPRKHNKEGSNCYFQKINMHHSHQSRNEKF